MTENMFAKLMNAIYHLNTGNGPISRMTAGNVIFLRHFVCNELMNLEDDDALIPAEHKIVLFFFSMLWCDPCFVLLFKKIISITTFIIILSVFFILNYIVDW